MKKKNSILIRFLLILNWISIFFLLLAYSAQYILASTLLFPHIIALAYPVIFCLNGLFVLLWLAIRYKIALYSGLAIVLGFSLPFQYIKLLNGNKKALGLNRFTILSYNVKQFGLYNYNVDWSYNFENRDQIIALMEDSLPDIICLQEAYLDTTNQFKTMRIFLEKHPNYKMHFEGELQGREFAYWGGATITRYPIVKKGETLNELTQPHNICFYTDVLIEGDTTRIYNLHLESFRLVANNYNYLREVKNLESKSISNKNEQKQLFAKIRHAFLKREEQVLFIKKHMESCRYPIIVCGDLNSQPCSYAYFKMSEGLEDSYESGESGISKTYAEGMPVFRIDYILHSNQFKALSHKVGLVKYSDHYPVFVSFEKQFD